MKIISLQTMGSDFDWPDIKLGDQLGRLTGTEVTNIELRQTIDDAFPVYVVYTGDGHERILPADKYVAEYAKE